MENAAVPLTYEDHMRNAQFAELLCGVSDEKMEEIMTKHNLGDYP